MKVKWTDMSMSAGKLTCMDILEEAARGFEMQSLRRVLETNKWEESLSKYRKVKGDLRVSKGTVIKSGALVILLNLRVKTLRTSHVGHPNLGYEEHHARNSLVAWNVK